MKLTVIYLLALLTYGCAAKKLAVDHADTIIELEVEKRLPLYSRQKEELSRDIDIFLNNKKMAAKDMLPVLDSIKLDQPQKIDAQYAVLMKFFRKISLDFSLVMAKYMTQLDKKQQVELFENLNKENKLASKKDPTERREALEDKIEKILRSISKDQKKILKTYDAYFISQHKIKVEKRREMYAQFKVILAQNIPTATKRDQLQSLYTAYYDDQTKSNKSLEIIHKFIPTISRRQKEAFRTQTQEIKEILNFFIQAKY